MRSEGFLVLCLALLLVAGCAASGPSGNASGAGQRPASGGTGARAAGPGRPGLKALQLAQLPAGTIGPYVGEGDDARLVVWAEAVGGQREWRALIIRATGEVKSPVTLAKTSGSVGLVAVRQQLSGEHRSAGYIVLFSTEQAGEHRLSVLLVGPNGEFHGGPFPIAESQDPLLWVEAIATEKTSLLLWASRQGQTAEIQGRPIDATGQPSAASRSLVTGVTAWQAVAFDQGVALGVVRATRQDRLGTVEVRTFGQKLDLNGQAVVISPKPTAQADLDMASIGEQLLVAWSDRRDRAAQLYGSALDKRGRLVTPPRLLTPDHTEQSLVHMVPAKGADYGYLIWEDLLESSREKRQLIIGTVHEGARVGPARAVLDVQGPPPQDNEFVATQNELLALTPARACLPGQCPVDQIFPQVVRFDPRLNVASSHPLALEAIGGKPALFGWGLSCSPDGCGSLAALGQDPTPVFWVSLDRPLVGWIPAARRLGSPGEPRLGRWGVLEDSKPLSDVAVARLDSRMLAATVTYFDPTTPYERPSKPAPDGRFAPVRALLKVQPVGIQAEPTVISYRARSLGGVALSTDTQRRGQALLAWTAIDNKEPQVFATIVSETGRRLGQRMLTHSAGDVSDVAATAVSDGWVVGWVDERHGDPEVYAAKVDRALVRTAPERRITQAPGGASGLSLTTKGDEVWMVWSDAKGNDQGLGDIFLSRVSAGNAKPITEAERLYATKAHSFAPVIQQVGEGAVVAWLEAPPLFETETGSGGVMSGKLGAVGRWVAKPKLHSTSGPPTGLALTCDQQGCWGVVTARSEDKSELSGFSMDEAGSITSLSRWGALSGSAGQTPPLAAVARTALVGDLLSQDRMRLRTVELAEQPVPSP